MSKFVFLILLFISFSNKSFANSKCEEFSRLFNQFIQSNIQTNEQLIDFFDQNTQMLNTLGKLIPSDNLYLVYYSDKFKENANVSHSNAQILKLRNQNIDLHAQQMKLLFQGCLEK